MTDTDKLLDYIRATERQKRLAVNSKKKLGSIKRTAEILSRIPVTLNGDRKIFKPNIFMKSLFVTMMLPVWTIALVMLIRDIEHFNFTTEFAFGGYSVFMGRVVWMLFFSKRLNYRITVSADGLAINEVLHRWQDVKETAILDLPIGRSGLRYLVIVLGDHSYEAQELSNFSGLDYPFHQKLARYIEHFKRLSQ